MLIALLAKILHEFRAVMICDLVATRERFCDCRPRVPAWYDRTGTIASLPDPMLATVEHVNRTVVNCEDRRNGNRCWDSLSEPILLAEAS